MKIDFNSKEETIERAELVSGSYEDMLKQRQKMLPQMQEKIQELLSDYQGQAMALIVMQEDENGDPTGVSTVIGGASQVSSSIKLASAIDEGAKSLFNLILESAKGDHKTLKLLLDEVTEKMIKEK